jgi:hypothetical protein
MLDPSRSRPPAFYGAAREVLHHAGAERAVRPRDTWLTELQRDSLSPCFSRPSHRNSHSSFRGEDSTPSAEDLQPPRSASVPILRMDGPKLEPGNPGDAGKVTMRCRLGAGSSQVSLLREIDAPPNFRGVKRVACKRRLQLARPRVSVAWEWQDAGCGGGGPVSPFFD